MDEQKEVIIYVIYTANYAGSSRMFAYLRENNRYSPKDFATTSLSDFVYWFNDGLMCTDFVCYPDIFHFRVFCKELFKLNDDGHIRD